MTENSAKNVKSLEARKTGFTWESQDPITVVRSVKKPEEMPAPINNEAEIILTLESNILDQGPLIGLGASTSATDATRCSTCKTCKPDNQSLVEHNLSSNDIKSLIFARGFNLAANPLIP